MSADEYNGWTNRETWAVALHINNDQGWQEQVLEIVQGIDMSDPHGAWDYDLYDRNAVLANRAGDALREHIEEAFDFDTHEGIFTRDAFLAMQDIGSLWRVDWDALGAAFLTDLAEQDS